jgi:elongator complex protein 3
MGFYEDLAREIAGGTITTQAQLERRKRELCKQYGIVDIPTKSDMLAKIPNAGALLLQKPTRSLSGVSVVAIMLPPSECPGKCIYCPRGEAAQSYTGFEPAAMRAQQNGFDAERQVRSRIRQLEASGHPTDKVELVVMGGTFNALPLEEQRAFVLGAFNGLNSIRASSVPQAHYYNERARHRCVGLTFETRPDWVVGNVEQMLEFGCTRVELGVQSIYDEVLRKVNRGHTVRDTIDATQLLRDLGLKVCYHVMPGLPGSSPEMDVEMFRVLFQDERFMPDMLKIYPCLLVKKGFYRDPAIHAMYERGEWAPLTNAQAVEIIARAKKFFPRWVRVMRIQRDIPAPHIEAGVTAGNLRELVHVRAHELGTECKCIRCREIGHVPTGGGEPVLGKQSYRAAGHEECFISLDTDKALYGFARVRDCADVARVRELHVYGPEARLGERGVVQHLGYGKLLMEAVEQQAVDWGQKRISVTSGVGVRDYYRQLGYAQDGAYMSKTL